MKAAILAGGAGTRLSEMTDRVPKPMVEIGGRPILWHIMKTYAAYGVKEFVIALGYKGDVIKDYFRRYRHHKSSMVIHLKSGDITVHDSERTEDWTVHLLDTGESTLTGGRLRRVMDYVGNEPILATYGDGVSDVNIADLVAFHSAQKRLATVTAVRPPARFGGLEFKGNLVSNFTEKPQVGEGWINGGYFVLEPKVREYLDGGDDLILEKAPMETLASDGQLAAYKHESFWQCMDTVRDLKLLESHWEGGRAPWKKWKD
jgi:glucose-1-phosphate cytidylyltransferase